LCKLYDKNENGTMMLAELENILSNLGGLSWQNTLVGIAVKNFIPWNKVLFPGVQFCTQVKNFVLGNEILYPGIWHFYPGFKLSTSVWTGMKSTLFALLFDACKKPNRFWLFV
jgi:hypothetical protein